LPAGDGDLRFTVPANRSSHARQRAIVVGERTLVIVQQGRWIFVTRLISNICKKVMPHACHSWHTWRSRTYA